MRIAVLVKVVPALENVRFDTERKTMVREGIEQFLNPFDARALRVALELRRAGETVHVLSMGPPAARAVLAESRALGADRATLVTDPRLAGSDSLVTARVLARALDGAGPTDLVLAGKWTTDSETGQVGPQVAGLLGTSVVSSARKIERTPEGPDELEITADTEQGWARYRVALPALVTVDEKIAKPRRPGPEELARVPADGVETRDVNALGLDGKAVGLAGSPTEVVRLSNEEPVRAGRVFADGPVSARVTGAVEAIAQSWAVRGASEEEVSLPPAPDPVPVEREIWVLVSDEDGAIAPAALALLSGVRRHAPRYAPVAVGLGAPLDAGEVARLRSAGAVRLLQPSPVGTPEYQDSSAATRLFDALLAGRPGAAACVFLSNTFGREVAGQLSARRGLGLVGDAVGLLEEPRRGLLWQKPAFGGGIVADIGCRTRPSLVTVRPGTWPIGRVAAEAPPDLPTETVAVASRPRSRVQRLGTGREIDERWGDLDGARTVVVVGMGIGGPERIPELLPALDRWPRSALAATRRVVDAGWLPRQLQVGLTGRTLAADLAVLVGVSGATNHVIGFRRTRLLLGLNANPAAPLFRGVDVGLVGSWEELWPPLLDALTPVARSIAGPSSPR